MNIEIVHVNKERQSCHDQERASPCLHSGCLAHRAYQTNPEYLEYSHSLVASTQGLGRAFGVLSAFEVLYLTLVVA
jgi:hypothetical protein